MNAQTIRRVIDGPAGPLEIAIDNPVGQPVGLALVAHPHPLHGGTLDNKVVQTLARAFLADGFRVIRPNFRGVGQSGGSHDQGVGEQQDLLAALLHGESSWSADVGPRRRVGGFSFGAVMASHLVHRWPESIPQPERLILVGLAPERFTPAPLGLEAWLIHGEADDVAPLGPVLRVAGDNGRPVLIIPGAGHFFHGQLGALKESILQVCAHRA